MDKNVRAWSSLTKTSHLLKSIKYLPPKKIVLMWKLVISSLTTTVKFIYENRSSDRLWNWSFWRSIATTESIWCTRIGTVLPKLMWNSLPKATWASFWSSLHRLLSGTSTSTTWRLGRRDVTFFRNKARSFFGVDGM